MGAIERSERRRAFERAILAEQADVLAELGVKRRNLGQIRMKCITQRGRVDDRIQMPHGTPGTIESVQCLGERHDDVFPRRGPGVHRNRFNGRAHVGQQLIDSRRDVRRFNRVEARQAGKFEQRI